MADNEVGGTDFSDGQEPSRRRFLKAAAVTGVAGAVWAEPLIRGIPAYAADASSIVGTSDPLGIVWSTSRANWEPNTVGPITRTAISGMNFNGFNNCGVNASWQTTINGETVTVMAVGGPSDGSGSMDQSCSDLNGTATISLEPQTGCFFDNVSVDDGTTTPNMAPWGKSITWTGADGAGMTGFMFTIDC